MEKKIHCYGGKQTSKIITSSAIMVCLLSYKHLLPHLLPPRHCTSHITAHRPFNTASAALNQAAIEKKSIAMRKTIIPSPLLRPPSPFPQPPTPPHPLLPHLRLPSNINAHHCTSHSTTHRPFYAVSVASKLSGHHRRKNLLL